MRQDAKAERQAEIEETAFRLLLEKGYGPTSMLAVAKAAKASNETLYHWYGDKTGLFRAMVERNAAATRKALETALREEADPLAALESAAPILLGMLLGERSVALNRAAAADPGGELGAALAAGGRGAIKPLIEAALERAMAEGRLAASSPAEAADWFFGLLIGDRQIRRAIRVAPLPAPEEVSAQAAAAMTAFRRLCAPQASARAAQSRP